VWTNVTNKLRMLLMLTRSNAYTRKPFKGVAALYRALRDGAGGDEGNPVFYVSSSPWNLYTPLVEFMRVQGIPRGPLFLKDFGDHTIFASRDHHTHKLASIEQILETYPHLPFILIGDSGEQDPEIYSEVVKRYPDRIRVIYIRNVNPDPSRIEAIDRLVEDVGRSGAQLVLAPDSVFAATHAAAKGLIVPTAVDDVRVDKREDEAAPAPPASAESRTD
jgi:phosphatidate phosphatase APP1